MARPVVGNPFDGQIGTVAPTARSVDTYERGVVKKSPFEALSRTLNNLEKKAVPALQAEEARRAEAEYAEGVELYNSNRVSMGQAVKDGLIAEGESPYLRKGFRISHLNTMSARYADELQNNLISKKLYTNGNPAAIESYTTKFYEEFQQKNGMDQYRDTEVAEFFSGAAAKANETFRTSWKSKHVAYQAAANYAAWSNEVSAYTATLFQEDDTPEVRQMKQDQLSTWLTGKVQQADVDGMNRAKVSKTVVDSIIMTAYETDNLEMLDILDNVVAGTGIIGHSVETRERIFNAEGNIAASMAKKEKAAATQIKNQNTANRQRLTGMIAFSAREDRLSSDPAVAAKAEEDIDNALFQLATLSSQGVAGASEDYRTLSNYVETMRNTEQSEVTAENEAQQVVLDEQAAEQHLQGVFNIEQEILKFDNVTAAINFAQGKKASGEINLTEMNSALTRWTQVKTEAPEAALHVLQATSAASRVRKNFITGLGLTSEFGEFNGANGIRKSRAELEFNHAYMSGLAEAQVEKGSALNQEEQYQLAVKISERLTPQLVNQAMLDDAQRAIADNNTAIAEAKAKALAAAAASGVTITDDDVSVLSVIKGSN